MAEPGRWNDLVPRILSAVVMIVVGADLLWIGGVWFHLLVIGICGGMMWELTRMLQPPDSGLAVPVGALAAGAMSLALELQGPWLAGLVVPTIVGLLLLGRDRVVFGAYALGLMVACYGLVHLRDGAGLIWVAWLIGVVIASDICGYFAGRILGGPKFWPRVSPKKTWSGTIAGWLGAACVGAGFAYVTGQGAWLPAVSALVAFASQMGDAAESAIKRHAGIKDSSSLIPGHGGLMDRFDAMMGAALFVFVATMLFGVPVVQG